jgi:hypothetical protein
MSRRPSPAPFRAALEIFEPRKREALIRQTPARSPRSRLAFAPRLHMKPMSALSASNEKSLVNRGNRLLPAGITGPMAPIRQKTPSHRCSDSDGHRESIGVVAKTQRKVALNNQA